MKHQQAYYIYYLRSIIIIKIIQKYIKILFINKIEIVCFILIMKCALVSNLSNILTRLGQCFLIVIRNLAKCGFVVYDAYKVRVAGQK